MHYAKRLNIKKEGEGTMGKYYNGDDLEKKHRDNIPCAGTVPVPPT